MRSVKPYDPPPNIEDMVLKICANNGVDIKSETLFEGLDTKFAVLNTCFQETGHGVPNSLLHTIETVGM